MDRPIVYPGQLPQDTDVLNGALFAMIGQGFLNQALLGSGTVVAGLACTPTGPASLVVNVGTGSIYQIDPIDSAAYGSLGTNSNSILKQGILPVAQSLTITPPGTTGFSQVYLVQAELADVDTGSQVLSYFNSANPAQPFSGPANSGSSNMTVRSCKCTIALKAGVPATTGTQTTPSPDAGFVGLYAITAANGATQVVSNNIALLPTAPFFPTLPQVPYGVQQGTYIYAGQDTGAANAYVITFAAGQPIPTSYVAGMKVSFKALNANTGASTVNVNGLGTIAIKRATGVALSSSDINSGGVVELTYDGTVFQMANYLGAGATSNTNTVVGIPYVVDSGTQNALVATYSPAITSGQQIAGLTIEVKLANTITGACTINVSGLGVKNVLTGDLANPPNGVFVTGEVLLLVYDGTQYQIANTSSLTYRKPSGNLSIYVNGAIGNDANDGVSNTSGHALATIGAGVLKAFSYAPSQFSITVVVEPGTYNEAVTWPATAGPNIIVDGLNAASVTVNTPNGYCFYVQGPNTATIKNLTVQNSGPFTSSCFTAVGGAIVNTSNTVSNGATIVFQAASGATMVPGIHTFSGSGGALYYCQAGGSMNLNAVHSFSTPISVSAASAIAVDNGTITVNTASFVNAAFVNGSKFSCTLNGVINTVGQGVNFFPGSVAGSTATGGQYA